MTYDDMNGFILNYLESDITGRALMLTGDWGSGKSYYVKEKLKSFLDSKDKKSVIVSLYGLSDVSEISRALFIELHPVIKKLIPTSGAIKAVGKTLLNLASTKTGFDLEDPSEEVLQAIIESVNLSDTLVVFEDIERTQIDIIKLLGYINNLCENDHVKILLVTNESELLTTYDKKDENGNVTKYYSKSAVSYKRAKEKTVGDTIHFTCDYAAAIQNILGAFRDSLQVFNSREQAEEIYLLIAMLGSINLRAFIYGCQKSRGILAYISENNITISEKIREIIFYGIIIFTQRQSSGADLHFESDTYFSGSLGLNDRLPLFRFCYDYIIYQKLSVDEVQKSVSAYDNYVKKSRWNSGTDKDLQIIKNFRIETELKVTAALSNLPDKIKDGTIPYNDYGVLANYVVAIRYEAEIEFDLDKIIQLIIDGLSNLHEKVVFETMFISAYTLYNPEGIACFEHIKRQMKDALTGIDSFVNFPYDTVNLEEYYEKYIKSSKTEIRREGFACKIQIEQFIEMIEKSSSADISLLRTIFMEIYRDQHYSQFFPDDIEALKSIHESIMPLVEYEQFDKIQKMQVKWFVRNLSDIIAAFDSQKLSV